MKKDKSCLVAMSSGVDSTVAALLLKEAGYHVEGLYLELLGKGFEKMVSTQKETVYEISKALGIRLHILDKRKEFEQEVIGYFLEEYRQGRTPNPCVFCNPRIKFKEGIEMKDRLGLGYFATGHYARISRDERFGHVLMRGIDRKKDQSYFLYRLEKEWLKEILFPLGNLKKDETRRIAQDAGLLKMVSKESQEICFVKEDYRELLKDQPEASGPIILKATGEVVGWHDGIHNFTIGQRRGLGIPGPEPYYVLELDAKENRVYIGTKKETYSKCFSITAVNFLVPEAQVSGHEVLVKVRSRAKRVPCTIYPEPGKHGKFKVVLKHPQSSVTPGQSAVFYFNDIVAGGGTICSLR